MATVKNLIILECHFSINTGVFLITGVISVGIIVIVDLAITFVTTKLENREPTERFGD
ncbi:MAG: hypothetical protein R3319_04650 [Candidatus Bathyarchaeia archaeon]|nr:hypothetical protein [Candidatus Bathyarchaeia archaeon]